MAQFHNVLIYALIGAALIALALDPGLDAAVIGAVVLINQAIAACRQAGAGAVGQHGHGRNTGTGVRAGHWLMIFSVSLLMFVLVEVEKWIAGQRHARR